MPKTDKIPCPMCGMPMNHHADKLDHGAAAGEHHAVDPDLGGVVQETHSCSNCGYVLFRRVT